MVDLKFKATDYQPKSMNARVLDDLCWKRDGRDTSPTFYLSRGVLVLSTRSKTVKRTKLCMAAAA